MLNFVNHTISDKVLCEDLNILEVNDLIMRELINNKDISCFTFRMLKLFSTLKFPTLGYEE